MNFLKSKAYKIMSVIEICVLVVIIALNLISSFASLSNAWNIAFFTIIIIGATYVIGLSITTIIILAKEKRKADIKQDEENK